MPAPASSALVSIVQAHRAAQAKLAEGVAALDERERRLRAGLEQIGQERASLEKQSQALALTEQTYRDIGVWLEHEALGGFDAQASIPDAHMEPPRTIKARIGPQRYRVFIALRAPDALTLEEVASRTRLPFKRVRDILLKDVQLGFAKRDGKQFALASAGLDLLARFEAYKRAKGDTLPNLDDPLSDDDHEESESEEESQAA